MAPSRLKNIPSWCRSSCLTLIILSATTTLQADPTVPAPEAETTKQQPATTLTNNNNLNNANNPEDSKNLYDNQCRDCHGRKGLDKALGRSKAISRMDGNALRQALLNYREKTQSQDRGVRAKLGLSDSEIDAVSLYIPQLTNTH